MNVRGVLVLIALCLAAGCAPGSQPDAGPLAGAVRAAQASGTQKFDHTTLNDLMAGAIRGGLVDYRKLQEQRLVLDAYLLRIAEAPLASLSKNEAFALLINAYNALTIRAILDHPQVKSIREIPGVWSDAVHRVGGFTCSLDQLEHGILRPLFTDPRVHFAINCASRSCAALAPFAYDGAKLEAQLDERRAVFLTNPANVKNDGGVLALSSYFDWFKPDFTTPGWRGAAPSVVAYVRPHATPEVRAFIDGKLGQPQLEILPYDWSLNAAVPPDPAIAGAPEQSGGLLATAARRVRAFTQGQGAFGVLVFGLVYWISVVLMVPAGPLTLAAGAAFGTAGGFAVVSVASTLGALTAFLIARYLLRERVRGWLERWPAFANVDRAIEHDGWKVVALARLSPVVPYTMLNYGLGVTSVRLVPYVLTSWLAMMPGTLLYVAAGAVSVDAATGGASLGFKVIGVLATGLTIWWISRAAQGKLTAPDSPPASAPAP